MVQSNTNLKETFLPGLLYKDAFNFVLSELQHNTAITLVIPMPKTDQFITLTVLILNQWILKTYHRMTSLCSYTSNQKMRQLIYNQYNGLVTCDKHVFNIYSIAISISQLFFIHHYSLQGRQTSRC